MTKEEVIEIAKQIGYDKGYKTPEDFYGGITYDDLRGNIKNINKIIPNYFYNINNLIRKCFPEFEFLEWKFKKPKRGFWKDKKNIQEYLIWLEKEQTGINGNLDNWHSITSDVIKKNYGSFFIENYLIINFFQILYFDFKYIKHNPFYNISLYLKNLEVKLGFKQIEDWYKINKKLLKINGAEKLLDKYTIYEIPSLIYSDYKFDIIHFNYKPDGFWNDFNNIKSAIMYLYNFYGRMPITSELTQIKGLKYGICKHGGLYKIADKLNIEIPFGYKSLSGHILKSMYELIFANFCYLNNIPFIYEQRISIISKNKYLFDFKINDIFIEIWGFYTHGQTLKKYIKKRKLKEKLYKDNNLILISLEYDFFRNNNAEDINCNLIQLFKNNKLKDSDFYTENLNKLMSFESFDKHCVMKELRDECLRLELIKFPSKIWWSRNGFKKHMYYLNSHYITIEEILGFVGLSDTDIKKRGYWKNFENIKKEILIITESTQTYPTPQIFRDLGMNSFITSVKKYHGGWLAVKEKLNLNLQEHESYRNPNGYFSDWKIVSEELLLICNMLNHFPTYSELLFFNKENLAGAIYKYHNGLIAAREKLNFKDINNYKPYPKPPNYWKEFKHVEIEILNVINTIKHYPTSKELIELGCIGLRYAIYTYYGGLSEVKERLNIK